MKPSINSIDDYREEESEVLTTIMVSTVLFGTLKS